jgi:hypothetical protein
MFANDSNERKYRRLTLTATFIVALFVSATYSSVYAQDEQEPPTIEELNAARIEALQESLPEGSELAAFLDCGRQTEVGGSEEGDLKIEILNGESYCFAGGLDVEGAFASQANVQYDAGSVSAKISGLDAGKKYRVAFSWWDYDDGGRTQMVVAKSPDQRSVRMPVPAIRVPDYETSGQLPGVKEFPLPMTVVKDGEMLLTFQLITGSNALVSEIWITETSSEE